MRLYASVITAFAVFLSYLLVTTSFSEFQTRRAYENAISELDGLYATLGRPVTSGYRCYKR